MELMDKDHLGEGQATPGMSRRQAFTGENTWTGTVVTAAQTASGWHHHGEHRSYLYVVRGAVRLENADGEQLSASTGDFVFIGPREVHREINPGDQESEVVLFRVGGGPVVVNVER
jgi:quercetin dioxygenase-like cupin family protein